MAERYEQNKIRVIKIVVDGYENNVLQSGSQFLARINPILVIEFAPYYMENKLAESDELVRTLKQYGYDNCQSVFGHNLVFEAEKLLELTPSGGSMNLVISSKNNPPVKR